MKPLYRLLFALHVFVGICAIAGGLAGIINPQTPLGMPVEQISNSPFNNYLIPALILFIIGIGNFLSALMYLVKSRFQGYISSVSSWALVVFIIVQCIMLSTVNFLHVIYFIIGLVEAGIAMKILFDQRLFPVNYILRNYKDTE